MLSIFTTMKPMTGEDDPVWTTQWNTLMSWSFLPIEIIVMGLEDGVLDLVQQVKDDTERNSRPARINRYGAVPLNEQGTPYVSDLFKTGNMVGSSDLLAYVNADILLFQDFVTVSSKIKRELDRFLMIGKRINYNLKKRIDFTNDQWAEDLVEDALENGTYAVGAAIDYFIHTRGLWQDIPDMALARYYWDNHLVWLAGTQERAPVIDATKVITCVHQDHPAAVGFDDLEARENNQIVAYRMAGIEHSTHHLTEELEIMKGPLRD